ncbi:Glu/Leu/Phe/Val dehydrogenase [Lentibacillus cibarius]|uniref:Glutamate dehydrogenase n=1 Tax=Lentibacillus cibarius TaxID=2583219 RepID=A0A549YIQ4_9BACI|nr:Glu/Leu/Phe/Val dehydrogenase dimerization domain-containing protein [Lentibacillus cibarius]TRM11766.1 Glu/Leu/Phe/Val dehydrogenase [Lentibacillus cibarius]
MEKPYLVIEWNDTETDATGWLVIHNFVKGYTSGGIRMHPQVTRQEVEHLAKTMAYKYVASESTTTGGCKGGIAYDYKASDAKEVLRRFVIAMMPYINSDTTDVSASLGEDLGTSYHDVLNVFKEFDFDLPITKSMKQDETVQKGINDYNELLKTKIDGLFLDHAVTGYGVAFSADEAWNLKGGNTNARVVIQGFGSVGASCALKLEQLGYKIVGISDANLLVTCPEGLDVNKLIESKNEYGEMDQASFEPHYVVQSNSEWLDVDCDIVIPAALENAVNGENAHKIKVDLVVEAANNPISKEGDDMLREKGVDIVNDFIANLGSIRFYDAILFGLIEPETQAVIDDIDTLCRKNVRKLFSEAAKKQAYQRNIAKQLFKPSISDTPGPEKSMPL